MVPMKVIARGRLAIHQIQFSQCILNVLLDNNNVINHTALPTTFELKDGNLFLSIHEKPENKNNNTVLYHSQQCPFNQNSIEPNEKNYIPVAVSMIVESLDNRVLLTKRASSLRASPSIWVPPGGLLELGEDLLEGGFREVEEETGLNLKSLPNQTKLLCMWENVFPILLGLGQPKTHILVIYYHVKIFENSEILTKKIKMNLDEVQAFAWLKPSVIKEFFTQKNIKAKETITQSQFIYDTEKNNVLEIPLPYLSIFNRMIWTSGSFYSGVQCSLYHWLEYYNSTQCKC